VSREGSASFFCYALFVKKASRQMLVLLCVALLCILLLGVVSLFLLCADARCPAFSLAKRQRAVDFVTCAALRFPVAQTHPPRCRVGGRTFYSESASRLHVVSPLDHEQVLLPLVIAGDVRVASGASLAYRLIDQDGYELVQDRMTLPKALSGQIVPFRLSVAYPRPMGTGGTLVIELLHSREQVQIPVSFAPLASVEVKAFFGNRERDPNALACDTSYPVARRVAIGENLLSASLRELLHGPTLSEQRQTFFTSIPQGVTVRSLTMLKDGKVQVVFSPQLTQGIGGSCRVVAIRSQIERTLRQFPHIEQIEISVEGSASGEVLQP